MFGRAVTTARSFRLAVPALGSLAAEPLYVLVDTAVVGHLGRAPLGGLTVAGTLLTTAFFLFDLLTYGTTAAVARRLGAGAHGDAVSFGVQGSGLSVVVGMGLPVVGVVAAPLLVGAMGVHGAVRPNALTPMYVCVRDVRMRVPSATNGTFRVSQRKLRRNSHGSL